MSSRSRRPKSTFFGGDKSMKRITNFFGGPDLKDQQHDSAPPTPPLAPDLMREDLPSPVPRNLRPSSQSLSSYKGRHSSLAPGNSPYLQSGMASSTPILAPPVRLGRRLSRPGTSSGGSRPSTPSFSLSGANSVMNLGLGSGFLPIFKKKTHERFGKGTAQHMAWILAPDSGTNMEPYDIQPLVRGEPAKELWFPEGDTVVYLTSSESKLSKYANPAFRIHSSALMFSALGAYIDQDHCSPDMQSAQPGTTKDYFLTVPGMDQFTPNDATEDQDSAIGKSVKELSPNSSPADSSIPRTSDEGMNYNARRGSSSMSRRGSSSLDPSESGVVYRLHFPILDDDVQSRPVTPGGRKSSKKPHHVSIGTSKNDAEQSLQRYIDARNLVAFLCGERLVASWSRQLPFDIFSKLFVMLNLTDVERNPDDQKAVNRLRMAEEIFQTYIEELELDDVSNDDSAIIEGLILGEKWRSVRLFHEAYIHAAGRWDELDHHPGIKMVSKVTTVRLDRAWMNLHQIRMVNILLRIPNFEFASVWVGEGRYSDYKGWRGGYDRMRSLFMNQMKATFGSWPPKAGKHGKGEFDLEHGGLNRIVLRKLYEDGCRIYDLTVDREWLGGERINFESPSKNESVDFVERDKRHRAVMGKIFAEFDKCSAPVQPEMPFNQPLIPYRPEGPAKKKKLSIFSKSSKRIKAEEINGVLSRSYNMDILEQTSEINIVKAFMQMEREFGTGKMIDDLISARRGAWIFLYCLLQSLVIAVIDAHGLRHGDGVEYFLCEYVKGLAPWEKNAMKRQSRMTGMWTTAPDGSLMNAVGSTPELGSHPDDEIELTYRRSHCWIVSEEWRMLPGVEESDEDSRNSSVMWSGEYIPGQMVPQSPRVDSRSLSPGEFPAYGEETMPMDGMQRQQLDGYSSNGQDGLYDTGYQAQQQHMDPSDQPSPIQNYQQRNWSHDGHSPKNSSRSGSPLSQQSPQSQSVQSQGYNPSDLRSPSQAPLPLTPTDHSNTILSPLVQLHPFEFDLTPLSEHERFSPDPSGSGTPGASRTTTPSDHSRHSSGGAYPPHAFSPAPVVSGHRKSSAPSAHRPGYTSFTGRGDGSSSPYSSPGNSPVLGPERASTMPRRLP